MFLFLYIHVQTKGPSLHCELNGRIPVLITKTLQGIYSRL